MTFQIVSIPLGRCKTRIVKVDKAKDSAGNVVDKAKQKID